MSAIDWDREFEEPWRSLGKAFLSVLADALVDKTSSLAKDRKAMRETALTRQEIAEKAFVSLKFLEMFNAGDTPVNSPLARRVRAVLAIAPLKPRPPAPWEVEI